MTSQSACSFPAASILQSHFSQEGERQANLQFPEMYVMPSGKCQIGKMFKTNESLPHATTWLNLQDTMRSEINQPQKRQILYDSTYIKYQKQIHRARNYNGDVSRDQEEAENRELLIHREFQVFKIKMTCEDWLHKTECT